METFYGNEITLISFSYRMRRFSNKVWIIEGHIFLNPIIPLMKSSHYYSLIFRMRRFSNKVWIIEGHIFPQSNYSPYEKFSLLW
jgi:hypothetical protein